MNSSTLNITVLGATGSIGMNTLDVVKRNSDAYNVFAVSGFSNIELLAQICAEFSPSYVAVPDNEKASKLKNTIEEQQGEVPQIVIGNEGLEKISSDENVDIVMAAIVGAAGLLPTMAAVMAGKKVLLANKEALVMSGELFMTAVKQYGAQLIPVDSEHNAIFQCLPVDFVYGDLEHSGISKILLTGSGGPFRTIALEDLPKVSVEQACAHPNWDMGRKISVDSASMMNKGLEFIEAKWLFGVEPSDIQVVLHPQSTIHSMVQYRDGSVLAQMGNPDMRTPIAHALAYPKRIDAGVQPLDFSTLANFTFESPCPERYPNLFLAIEACKRGQAATTALNAANEIAVEAFLNEQIGFCDIYKINQRVVELNSDATLSDIDAVIRHDKNCRISAHSVMSDVIESNLSTQMSSNKE